MTSQSCRLIHRICYFDAADSFIGHLARYLHNAVDSTPITWLAIIQQLESTVIQIGTWVRSGFAEFGIVKVSRTESVPPDTILSWRKLLQQAQHRPHESASIHSGKCWPQSRSLSWYWRHPKFQEKGRSAGFVIGKHFRFIFPPY